MTAFFNLLLAKIAAALAWIGELWVAIFKAAWDLLRDVMTWPVDQFLSLAVTAVNAFDVSAFSPGIQRVGSVPAEIGNLLSLLGVGTAITIIVTAIGIRLVLQLIPFTRLGS